MREVLAALVAGLLAVGCSSSSGEGGMEGASSGDGSGAVGGGAGAGGDVGAGSGGGAGGDSTGGGGTGSTPDPVAGSGGAGGNDSPVTMGCAICPECDANCYYPDIRGTGSCAGLDSGYPGDETCLPAPEPGEGIQIHVGPADYGNAGDYEFAPNLENSLCKDFVTPNTEDVYYQGWVMSARTGTHHIIDTCFTTGTVDPNRPFGQCRGSAIATDPDGFGIPGASKPYMPRTPVAPENANLGAMLPANAQCQADMHYFNFTPSPVLREMWLNLYTKPADEITATAQGIRGMGGVSWALFPIAAGTDKVYKYQFPPAAPTTDDARITMLLGHYHAHGIRFSAFLNGEKVFEMFDYNEPLIFHYNSVSENPPISTDLMVGGAKTGMLPIKAGDVLSWECHIINDSTAGLTYTNEVETGEMCNLWGSSVGVKFDWVEPFFGSGN